MLLFTALQILADVHTSNDGPTGFSVMVGAKHEPYHRFSEVEYIQAWEKVRQEAGQPTGNDAR